MLEGIDDFADHLAGQYRQWLASVTGHYAHILDQVDPTSQKARIALHRNLATSRATLLGSLTMRLEYITDTVRHDAIDALEPALRVPNTDALDAHVGDLLDDTGALIGLCAQWDCLTAERSLRKLALNTDLLMQGGMSRVGALLRTHTGAVGSLRFTQQDSLGRYYQSERFVRNVIRQHLIHTAAESTLFALAGAGHDYADILKDGAKVQRISIVGKNSQIASYDEVKDVWFHPNSTAVIRAVED